MTSATDADAIAEHGDQTGLPLDAAFPPHMVAAILPGSRAQTLPEALGEWIWNTDEIDYTHKAVCDLCGQRSLYRHYPIVNTYSGARLLVGSECINKFGDIVIYDADGVTILTGTNRLTRSLAHRRLAVREAKWKIEREAKLDLLTDLYESDETSEYEQALQAVKAEYLCPGAYKKDLRREVEWRVQERSRARWEAGRAEREARAAAEYRDMMAQEAEREARRQAERAAYLAQWEADRPAREAAEAERRETQRLREAQDRADKAALFDALDRAIAAEGRDMFGPRADLVAARDLLRAGRGVSPAIAKAVRSAFVKHGIS